MKILLQSVGRTLNRLRQKLGSDGDGILFTKKHREVMSHVQAGIKKPGRTVVVSSMTLVSIRDFEAGDTVYDRFMKSQRMNGRILAGLVKSADPKSWFFIYSYDRVAAGTDVDGVINKGAINDSLVVEFLRTDFDAIESLAELRERFPWLE